MLHRITVLPTKQNLEAAGDAGNSLHADGAHAAVCNAQRDRFAGKYPCSRTQTELLS